MTLIKPAKIPEPYLFDPLPDITAYELARIIQAKDYARYSRYDDFVKYLESLPDSVKRHLTINNERLLPPRPTSAVD